MSSSHDCIESATYVVLKHSYFLVYGANLLLHLLCSLLYSFGRCSQTTCFILIWRSATTVTKGKRSLLGELTLVMSLEWTVHYTLVGSELVWSHLLSGHILFSWHMLQWSSDKAFTLSTTLRILSLEKVVDKSSFMACHRGVIHHSRESRLTATSYVVSIRGCNRCAAFFIIVS